MSNPEITDRYHFANLPGDDLDEVLVEYVARALHRSWHDDENEAECFWEQVEGSRWNYLLDARTALRALSAFRKTQ